MCVLCRSDLTVPHGGLKEHYEENSVLQCALKRLETPCTSENGCEFSEKDVCNF